MHDGSSTPVRFTRTHAPCAYRYVRIQVTKLICVCYNDCRLLPLCILSNPARGLTCQRFNMLRASMVDVRPLMYVVEYVKQGL